ncbi:hypothetical protein [Fibrobacter sp.]|uniref:hypothetical protein n=1 Tax=Fibrobacter sp. TaxID=35828 RepID=UPI00388E79D1
MKRVFILSTILMMAGAMNAWAAACAKDAAGKYGAITIATVDGKCVATLDPDATTDTANVNILNDIAIDQFVYDRNFKVENTNTGNAVFTICLPFDVNSNGNYGGNLYKISTIQNYGDEKKPNWQIVAQQNAGPLYAGVPYFIQNVWNDNLTLIPAGPINTSSLSPVKFGENDVWEFRGTYTYKKWEDGDSQIGHVYGFAAKKKDNVKAGQFVKIKAGAYIKPMRAYLYYNKKSANAGRPAANGVKGFAAIDDEDLPNTIEVVFQDKNGETTSIAQMNTVTGEFTSVTGWYDMKGRKLDKKPTQKGTYFNNGKKVVIK